LIYPRVLWDTGRLAFFAQIFLAQQRRDLQHDQQMGAVCSRPPLDTNGDIGGTSDGPGDSAPFVEELQLASALETHLGAFWKSENQDDYFVCEREFGGRRGHALFCVFDGHGTNGKKVAGIARNKLPQALLSAIDEQIKSNADSRSGESGDAAAAGAKDTSAAPATSSETGDVAGKADSLSGVNFELALVSAFLVVQSTLKDSRLDCSCSGATASVAYFVGNDLYVANVGDSRVVLGQALGSKTRRGRAPAGKSSPMTLTRDHRLSLKDEFERCQNAGARIQPKKIHGVFVGEKRLWLKDLEVPGLVVTRSLGDTLAATIGCSAVPEVTRRRINANARHHLILASDGVWDVLSNEEVVDTCSSAATPESAVAAIRDASLDRWEQNAMSDNITVLYIHVCKVH